MNEKIWERTVDNKTYEGSVVRIAPYEGILMVRRLQDNVVIHTQKVGISYDAIVGPDMGDVSIWEQITIKAIDGKS